MMRNSKVKKIFVTIAMITSIGALSACRGHSPEKRIDRMAEKFSNKLDLNSSQKDIVKSITDEMKKDFAEEKINRLAAKEEIKKLVLSTELDQDKVKSLIKQRQERMNVKVDKYVEKIALLHKTLTADQKKEILETMDKFTRGFEE